MWLIRWTRMLYGEEDSRRKMDVHQELKRRDLLTPWYNNAEIIFVRTSILTLVTTYHWLNFFARIGYTWMAFLGSSSSVRDQLRVLCLWLNDWSVENWCNDYVQAQVHNEGQGLETILNRTYLWVDWFSMPQKVEDIGEKAMDVKDGRFKAIRSIPAYVEDFILILVPSLYHSDRKVPTCYRTWRRRGVSTIRSSNGERLVESSVVGEERRVQRVLWRFWHSDFTCCQRNHIITTETQKKRTAVGKDRATNGGGIFEQLIDAKVNHSMQRVIWR